MSSNDSSKEMFGKNEKGNEFFKVSRTTKRCTDRIPTCCSTRASFAPWGKSSPQTWPNRKRQTARAIQGSLFRTKWVLFSSHVKRRFTEHSASSASGSIARGISEIGGQPQRRHQHRGARPVARPVALAGRVALRAPFGRRPEWCSSGLGALCAGPAEGELVSRGVMRLPRLHRRFLHPPVALNLKKNNYR